MLKSLTPSPEPGAALSSSRRVILAATAVIALAALWAYANSFSAAFVYDDTRTITLNPSIRRLWPLSIPLSPPAEMTTEGRPIANLTFAINYAIGKLDVRSYHVVNLLIHVLAGLTLFGVVRRTLERTPSLAGGRLQRDAAAIALATAVLWTLHPLQTESVTYTVQRVESLMGLFYLFTLYAFIRATTSPRPGGWYVVSVLVCVLGMATKEVMVSAPVMVLLYDRIFVSGTFRTAWKRHGGYHVATAATWLLLAYLITSTGGTRSGAIGFSVGVPAAHWWLTQFEAITRYLWLSFWPHPLVFDYGMQLRETFSAAFPFFIVVSVLVGGTLYAVVKYPAVGFLGLWFFAILSPTSVVPGTTQMIVEHRMYLALAPVMLLATVAAYRCFGRRAFFGLGIAALVFAVLTHLRNHDYRTAFSIWEDTVAKRPNNPLAYNGHGFALIQAGRPADAIPQFQEALRRNPTPHHVFSAHSYWGDALLELDRPSEALEHLSIALQLRPDDYVLRNNYGDALLRLGKPEEALKHFQYAAERQPDRPKAHHNIGIALFELGRPAEALPHHERALRLHGEDDAKICFAIGNALFQLERKAEAIEHYRRAIRVDPAMAVAHCNLASALVELGRLQESIGHFEEAVRLKPDYAFAHGVFGSALLELNRVADAIRHLRIAVQLAPGDPHVHNDLGTALALAGLLTEARDQFIAALKVNPDLEEARRNLELLYSQNPLLSPR